MKNKYDDFSILTDFDNLYAAHKSCRKGKRWKDSVAIYDIRAYECTLKIQELLTSGKYRLSPYNCFTVNERGKAREIKSIKYHDRIAQKSLNDNILVPVIVPKFIDANCASQSGKGTDYALTLCTKNLRREVRKHGAGGYVLVCDMHDYFGSIPHALLNEFYERYFSDRYLVGLIHHIHATIPGGVGVPLGNQLSQLDALLALSPLDHIVKEKLHIEGYGRYMDDFYLIHDDKQYLRECLAFIKSYVEERGMSLNSKKTKIVTMKQGFDFLGFRFHVTDTGKVIQKLAKKSIKHHKHKLKKMRKLLSEGKVSFRACLVAHNGWKAHVERGRLKRKELTPQQRKTRSMPNTYYLVRKMDRYFNELFGDQRRETDGTKTKQPSGRSTSEDRSKDLRKGDNLEGS